MTRSEAILAYLRTNGPTLGPDLCRALSLPSGSLSDTTTPMLLRKELFMRKEPNGKGRKVNLYWLPDQHFDVVLPKGMFPEPEASKKVQPFFEVVYQPYAGIVMIVSGAQRLALDMQQANAVRRVLSGVIE